MNANLNYRQIVADMPNGLDRAILSTLAFHVGRDRAIGRGALVAAVKQSGIRVHERQAREMIKDLRRQGHLICAAPGEDGGYYLAADRAEFEDFLQAEYMAKIADMSETAAAMRQAANAQFGEGVQISLF